MMTNTPLESQHFDGQWLDFYALLDLPQGADEDAIRKRIGKVYADAAAQSDHRDLSKRHYYQALVERVLPQCRRVLLDPQWREKYDRQHALHAMGDSGAQNYVAFIASMRGGDLKGVAEEQLPARVRDEISAARGVMEVAHAGAELELLPSSALSVKAESAKTETEAIPAKSDSAKADATKTAAAPKVTSQETKGAAAKPVQSAPKFEKVVETGASQSAPQSENIAQKGEPVRATVITAQEAALLRGRRASNPDANVPVQIVSDLRTQNKNKSRVIVEDAPNAPRRLISPTSLNLMVAITGVLLTITIQQLAVTPAVATSQTRLPLYLAASPEMAPSLNRLESAWENSQDGQGFDLVIQPLDGTSALRRVSGQGGAQPDAWIPASSLWIERYNSGAQKSKRALVDSGVSLAQTPLVLIARGDRSGVLKSRFPGRQISSWNALRSAVSDGAAGHFGLSAPQKTVSGTLARASMAREWGASRGLSATQAANSPEFWRWMNGFEDQVPAQSASQSALIKDLVLGTTGRFWWAIGYESEALEWMKAGHNLEVWTLPRTSLADHPFVGVERIGAPVEVARGRVALANFLRSQTAQQTFLRDGFRPTEIAPSAQIKGNPFRESAIQKNGVRIGLPRDERINAKAAQSVESGWEKRFG